MKLQNCQENTFALTRVINELYANLSAMTGEENTPVPCMVEGVFLNLSCALVVVTSSFILISIWTPRKCSSFQWGHLVFHNHVLLQKKWERFLSIFFSPYSVALWIHKHPPALSMSWGACCICSLCSHLCHSLPVACHPFQGWPCLSTACSVHPLVAFLHPGLWTCNTVVSSAFPMQSALFFSIS